jgi:CopG family nickel-responsive transcriptional regulator
MRRITLSLDDTLADQFDDWADRHQYQNRSEAFRDLLRARLETEQLAQGGDGDCAAAVSFVYDHHERQLSSRLAETQHAHHGICLSTLHVHLDHDSCLEITVLRGPMQQLQAFAQALIAERGVRHGKVQIVPLGLAAPAAARITSITGAATGEHTHKDGSHHRHD